MIEGETRRKEIIETLVDAENLSVPVNLLLVLVSAANHCRRHCLLRAAGEAIVATARGYLLEDEQDKNGFISKIAVQHQREQTEEELQLIVAHGGEILETSSLSIPLYGELIGMLHIKTAEDIRSFMKRYRKKSGFVIV